MLKLQITRDGTCDDEYLELPATPADVGEIMARLDETSADVASTRIYGAISDVWITPQSASNTTPTTAARIRPAAMSSGATARSRLCGISPIPGAAGRRWAA